MTKILTILSGLTLGVAGSSPIMAMAPRVQNIQQSVSAQSITSDFDVTGDWGNAWDYNGPEWALPSNNSRYVQTYARVIKRASWSQMGEVSLSFTINFNRIGGDYYNSNKYYDLNSLSNTKLVMTTIAGQPAHNKEAGWPEQTETFNFLQLINEGINYHENGTDRNWRNWAHFSSSIDTIWSQDKTSLTIKWEAKNLFLKASKWTDGLFFRLELMGLETKIDKK